MRSHLKLSDARQIARTWSSAGGTPHVDIAALEPLLWRDGDLEISDLVSEFKEHGFTVALTTNGHHLARHATRLAASGVDKVRVSWHTTSPSLFREISATGVYEKFLDGVQKGLDAGLNITFNRVLLRPHVADLAEHIQYVRDNGMHLKIYDLLWTPAISDVYEENYVNATEVAEKLSFLGSGADRTETSGAIGRRRTAYEWSNGAKVEFKESSDIKRENEPCLTCPEKDACLEGFGDYIRVEPELKVYFCYLRRDFGFDGQEAFSAANGKEFMKKLDEMTDGNGSKFLTGSKLRLIAVPLCNFNCGLPGTNKSWCHKATGDFYFPPRKSGPIGSPKIAAE